MFKRATAAESRLSTTEGSWVPNTDVCMNDDGLVIKAEIAGMRREDLELTVEGNALRIRGCREDAARPAKCSFLVMEINYGCFESVIELPEGFDLAQAKAVYQNGFLRVDVPRKVMKAKSSRVVPVRHDGE
ncbi:MAG: Hsp20/alpha crystallin family protein [Verrucomicrobia bacterium]|nr:Hsp20/alpha crystallin family protein [Verrucomicrobiota bacterium]